MAPCIAGVGWDVATRHSATHGMGDRGRAVLVPVGDTLSTRRPVTLWWSCASRLGTCGSGGQVRNHSDGKPFFVRNRDVTRDVIRFESNRWAHFISFHRHIAPFTSP